MVLEVLLQLVGGLLPQLEDDKGLDEVSLDGVGFPDDRGLCNRLVGDEGTLDFSGADIMTRQPSSQSLQLSRDLQV